MSSAYTIKICLYRIVLALTNHFTTTLGSRLFDKKNAVNSLLYPRARGELRNSGEIRVTTRDLPLKSHVVVFNLSPGLLVCIMSVHREPWDQISAGNAAAGDLQSQFAGLNVGAMPFIPNINAQPFVPGGSSGNGYRHSQPYYQHGMGKKWAFIRKLL